jgi:alpha-tubulin suppressor-like RCC1 family protein
MTMKNREMLLPFLLSMALVFSLILAGSMPNTAPVMARAQATRVVAGDTMYCAGFYRPSECIVGGWRDISQIAAGTWHTVGLKSDGTVVAAGDNHFGECDVGGWTEIIEVAASGHHTVGVKSDGTMVAVGRNNGGCCDVGNWTGINQTATGHYHTVGLRSDGTVVAVGPSHWSLSHYGQCDVGNWTDIIQVTAGGYHTVGLKDDGTVVAVGRNDREQCNVGNWTGIIQVAAGYDHTVGLKSDGTVVATGSCKLGRCGVGNWTDIIQVGAGEWITVGVRSDGTAVAAPDDEDSERCKVGTWRNIIQVAGGSQHTVGLRSDGTVVAACGWLTTIPPGSGCFIATAAYGTPMAEEIDILRRFRDEYLLTNPLGQGLVNIYYKVSPPVAEFITEHPGLKPVVRAALLPAVAMSTVVVNTTLAEKVAVVGLFVLFSVTLAVWATRRRQRDPEYS